MSVSGRNWEVALGRITRARFKAAKGLGLLEDAQEQLVEGEPDEVIYKRCREAEQELNMAVAILHQLRRPQLG